MKKHQIHRQRNTKRAPEKKIQLNDTQIHQTKNENRKGDADSSIQDCRDWRRSQPPECSIFCM